MDDSGIERQSSFPFGDSDKDQPDEGTRGPNADDTRHYQSLMKRMKEALRTMGELSTEAVEPIDLLKRAILLDRAAYIRLALVPGVGAMTMMRLLSHFGDADSVLRASLSQLGQVNRVGPVLATSIRESKTSGYASRVLDHCNEMQISITLPGDATFPKRLANISDPPLLLFMRGEYRSEDELAVGMVGTRHATTYGCVMAEKISRGLCYKRITVVSGLARGIDSVCHRTALEHGGRTIAVLGSSLSEVYPVEHASLADSIAQQGCLLSETPPFSQPRRGVFPQRNRIISGLSEAIVVVEAAERSGSLITASHAGNQGRTVFAVPGPATSRTSQGCNRLIRDGAILVQCAEDVIEGMGPLPDRVVMKDGTLVDHPRELQLNEVEKSVLSAISDQPTDVDKIVTLCGLEVSRVLSTLSVLEIHGFIVRTSNRSFARRRF